MSSTLAISLYEDTAAEKAKTVRNKRLKWIGASVAGILVVGAVLGTTLGVINRSNHSGNNDDMIANPGDSEGISVDVSDAPLTLTRGALYRIPKSTLGKMFMLYIDNRNVQSEHDIPAARSYDGGDWEPLFPVLLQPQSCNNVTCGFVIPANGKYTVVQVPDFRRSLDASISDFLMQATFGPTLDSIRDFPVTAVNTLSRRAREFILQQMEIPATLHREYYRSQASPQVPADLFVSRPIRGSCVAGARYERAAFDAFDSDAELRLVNNSLLYVNGELRTQVSENVIQSLSSAGNGPWYLCRITRNENKVGDLVKFKNGASTCRFSFAHPSVAFTNSLPEASQVVSRNANMVELNPSIESVALLGSAISNCDANEGKSVFARDSQGVWYRFQPRLRLFDNGLSSTSDSTLDSKMNVRKNFLNEKSCVPVRSETPIQFRSSLLNLTASNLQKFQQSDLYVYYVTGLKASVRPCKALKARFQRRVMDCPNPANITNAARTYLSNLIQSADIGLDVVDVLTNKRPVCSNLNAGIELQIGNVCWTHVHDDLYNVFDFSSWVDAHPGGKAQIKQFATRGSVNLEFPHSNEMFKWDGNRDSFPYLGVFGSTVDFLDLPTEVQLESIARHFQAIAPGSGVVAYNEKCGSAGETANLPRKGNRFIFQLDNDYVIPTDELTSSQSKVNVWSNIALFGNDQLRQRVAWALAQILVINHGNILLPIEQEAWVNYYDIFVRNAFGNYFDVLKEVSYAPMMGLMLSYRGGRSYQRNFELYGFGKYPDENYAREIMQLFTIGLWKLNNNGTKVSSRNGKILETYTNENIENLARIWTGFITRPARENLEFSRGASNLIDPMTINAADHDSFPKQGLDGLHIGDGYPLCNSLPSRSFLRSGAKYRYLGSSAIPVMHSRAGILSLNASISALYRVLCNADARGKCQFLSALTLPSNLPCSGLECNIDTVKMVQINFNVSDVIYYEYVQVPCVRLEFFEQGKVTTAIDRSGAICSDPSSFAASAACCSRNTNSSRPRTRFSGEMLSFGSAQNVCSTFNQDLCVYSSVGNLGGTGSFRTWSSDSCKVQAQVFADGSVGVIHDSQSTWNPPDVYGLQADSNINLRVNWAGNSYPKASGKCTAGCQVWKNTCICDVKVANNAVFTNASDIPSVEDVLRLLTIGAPALSMFDTGVYRQVHRNENSGLYIYSTAPGVFDMNTIFEVRSEGRRTQFFVNMRSMVRIGNNFMFRNPPNFMRHEERTLRDAEYEVDALLEHLLYHPNTAPFVADFMIKRFVTSNPSPAYINTVAQAFKSGKYSGIGSGKYGDMAATISAVLLDRDSLSVTVKSDFSFGKFREPLMKVMHVMRSLNLFVKDGNQANFADLNKLLGQEPYFAPSVFNFYQSEFRTSGAVENSGLFSPEGQILTTPRILRYLNGLISLVEFGTTSCFTTFGVSRFANCNLMKTGQVDPVAYNSGYLNYAAYFRGLSGPAIVDRLDVLLSGGRLSAERKQLLAGVYSSITPAPEALKNVIELFFSTPEFQISGTAPEFQVEPPKASKPRPIYDSSQYKAIVYIFLNGGMDSYNLIVPHSGCSGIDLYEQYEDIRTDAAVPKGSLLRISTPSWGTPQPCNQFGIHPSMPFLKSLYNSNETAFISNIGTLVEPMTKAEYIAQAKKRPIGLFAHNVQQSIIRRVDADSFTAKGVLGRISDHFTSRRRSVSSYSVCGTFASVLEGELGVSESQVIMNAESGIETFDKDDLKPNLRDHVLNLNRKSSPSIFADTWNDFLSSGISRSSDLKSVFDAADVSTDFDSLDSDIASQLKQVSTVIASRGTLKSSLDLFNVEMGGFDTHNSFTTFGDNMAVIDAALQAFVSEMKRQNIWDKVTVVVSSDFARTLGSNGHGTDHAWAGNTFFLGGSVKGGQILGKYPSSLAEDGDVNIGNGRLLPTTSWEALWNGVSQWLGIMDGDALNRILPNRANFLTGNNLFTKADMFDN